MAIEYKNMTYMSMEKFNKYEDSVEKIIQKINDSIEKGNSFGEQSYKRDLLIAQGIERFEIKYNLKVLNYYCQGCEENSFVETVDGEKYIYEKYKRILTKNDKWNVV